MWRSLTLVACASLLAGCASYSWYNPNVPPEIAARDADECRRQAAYAVNMQLMAYDPYWPGAGWGWGSPFAASGLELEQDAIRRCMTFKGYQLVKDPQPVSGR